MNIDTLLDATIFLTPQNYPNSDKPYSPSFTLPDVKYANILDKYEAIFDLNNHQITQNIDDNSTAELLVYLTRGVVFKVSEGSEIAIWNDVKFEVIPGDQAYKLIQLVRDHYSKILRMMSLSIKHYVAANATFNHKLLLKSYPNYKKEDHYDFIDSLITTDLDAYNQLIRDIASTYDDTYIEYLVLKSDFKLSKFKPVQQQHILTYQNLIKYIKLLGSAPKIKNIMSLLPSEPNYVKSINEFDTNPTLIATKDSYFDLKADSIIPPCPTYMVTSTLNVDTDYTILSNTKTIKDHINSQQYNCPVFLKMLNTIFQNDSEIINFIQVVLGSCLVGSYDKSKLFIFTGTGSNGKSTLISILLHILGDLSVSMSAADLITTNSKTNIEYRLALLKGKRCCITNESEHGDRLASGLVKTLLGNDTLTARHIYGSPFQFKPQATQILLTNNKPNIDGNDYAIGRRMVLIPFNAKIKKENIDLDIEQKLIKEKNEIYKWLLNGARIYNAQGFHIPEKINKETSNYLDENNVISQFMLETYNKEPNSKLSFKTVWIQYQLFCKDFGKEYVGNRQNFESQLNRGGFNVVKNSSKTKILEGYSDPTRNENEAGVNEILDMINEKNNKIEDFIINI